MNRQNLLLIEINSGKGKVKIHHQDSSCITDQQQVCWGAGNYLDVGKGSQTGLGYREEAGLEIIFWPDIFPLNYFLFVHFIQYSQGLANCDLLPVFLNNVLLEHSYTTILCCL